MRNLIPLSLYIHLPWCVRKCPYCDFNSHELKNNLPEKEYVAALLQELDSHLHLVADREIRTIFFGGGTPSLFSGAALNELLMGVKKRLSLHPHIEITLEANPGTIDLVRFADFKEAGINRLSLGIQSLQDEKLKVLGRIHDSAQAMRAIEIAKEVGFNNFNIDIMFGLPNQSIEDALYDIKTALSFNPTHFSWYQLTIEPNTVFYRQTPSLPADELLWDMQLAGQAYLQKNDFQQYEVSAYAKPGRQCLHNVNYWEFGDYLGIGVGAHSKITDLTTGNVTRFSQMKQPKDYMNASKRKNSGEICIPEKDLIFEFMLNALRLTNGFPVALFTGRTGLPIEKIESILLKAQSRDLLEKRQDNICLTGLGKRFLNDVVTLFLP